MKFKNFSLQATPIIQNPRCNNCGSILTEMSDGFFSSVWYCPLCDNIYKLKLVKIPDCRITKEFLKHCQDKIKKE